jgi:hypothetical protein
MCSLEMSDPEVNEVEMNADGHITSEVRIVRTSACCGDEVKESTFNTEDNLDEEIVKEHKGGKHGLIFSADDAEPVERTEGKGRSTKTFFGYSINWTVRCDCQAEADDPLATGTLTEDVQASAMDEMS